MKITSWSWRVLGLSLAGLTACSSPTSVVGAVDAGMTPADVTCIAGERVCGGQCVDPQRSVAHCGACGNACPPGNVCANGACAQSCPSS